ncbi:MAG TPA: arylesterase [Blastocatellia bacterium]|nr:arylesterase [Blastocatellia bacterium]
MKSILLSLILLGTIGLGACKGQATNETSVSPASPPSASPASTASPSKSVPKIIAFGDSLTAGYGLSPVESYPSLLQKRLEADGFNYEVVNAGVSGDVSAGGLRRVDWAMEGDVRVVIIELGANDILRGQPVDQMKRNLGQIIERAKARGAEVLLAGMEAPTNSGPEYRREVHEAFPALAREHNVPLIPFFLDGVAGIERLNLPDGIHPNAEGTRIVAETVYKYLRPILEKESAK